MISTLIMHLICNVLTSTIALSIIGLHVVDNSKITGASPPKLVPCNYAVGPCDYI